MTTKPDRGQPGGALAAPAEHGAGQDLEGVEQPRADGDQDLRIGHRHRVDAGIDRDRPARLHQPDQADEHAGGEAGEAADDGPAVHLVERGQRRQPRVEHAGLASLQLAEQQHVGQAHDGGDRERRVGEQHERDVEHEQRAVEHRRPRPGLGAGHGDERQHGDERRDERAHRPLPRRQLDVEVDDGQQPHEPAERVAGADQRQRALAHRGHPEEERVHDDAGPEGAGRRLPERRLAADEVRGVEHGTERVERGLEDAHRRRTTSSSPGRNSPASCARRARAWWCGRRCGATVRRAADCATSRPARTAPRARRRSARRWRRARWRRSGRTPGRRSPGRTA